MNSNKKIIITEEEINRKGLQTLKQYIQENNSGLGQVISFMIITAWPTLVLGVFLPVMHMGKHFWIIELDNNTLSILGGIWTLLTNGEMFLGLVILVFSIVIPVLKLLLITSLWNEAFDNDDESLILSVLSSVSKWSMLDVFVVAVSIVACKLSSLADAEARIGIYVFSLHVFVSMGLSVILYLCDKRRIAEL